MLLAVYQITVNLSVQRALYLSGGAGELDNAAAIRNPIHPKSL